MTTTTNVAQVKLNVMTQSQYNSATKNPTELYMITDAKVDYDDLDNKPTIPTESTVSGWGFTKNVGTVTSVNNTQPDANGNVTINTGSLYTAGTGIDITNNAISVTAPTLVNTATAATSLNIKGNDSGEGYAVSVGNGSTAKQSGVAVGRNALANRASSVVVGSSANSNGDYGVAIGESASIYSGTSGIAIGYHSQTQDDYAIQIGYGYNPNASTLSIGFQDDGNGNSVNYQLLDGTTGLIPDARISSNIARTSAIPTVDQTYDGTSVNPQSGVAIAGAGFITGITSGDVTTALGYTPADDSNVVKTSGNQDIAGTKTFTGTIQVDGNIGNKNPNVTKGTNPEATQYWSNYFVDKNGASSANSLGAVITQLTADGLVQTSMYAYKNASGTTNARISIYYPATGDPYTYAPTPVTSDNSTKIATTAYVQAQSYATNSTLSSSPYLVLYGTSTSAADATAKIVEISSSYATTPTISAGQLLIVTPTITSTVADSTITVQKSSTTLLAAKTMKYNNTNITTSTDSIVWSANIPSIFVYDGTYWQFLGHGLDNNTTYSAMSVSEGTTGTATSSRVMRADYLKQIIEGLAISQTNTYYDSASSTLYIG